MLMTHGRLILCQSSSSSPSSLLPTVPTYLSFPSVIDFLFIAHSAQLFSQSKGNTFINLQINYLISRESRVRDKPGNYPERNPLEIGEGGHKSWKRKQNRPNYRICERKKRGQGEEGELNSLGVVQEYDFGGLTGQEAPCFPYKLLYLVLAIFQKKLPESSVQIKSPMKPATAKSSNNCPLQRSGKQISGTFPFQALSASGPLDWELSS